MSSNNKEKSQQPKKKEQCQQFSCVAMKFACPLVIVNPVVKNWLFVSKEIDV
jgi:hypothetical protein